MLQMSKREKLLFDMREEKKEDIIHEKGLLVFLINLNR
jgi:hypothetical protein